MTADRTALKACAKCTNYAQEEKASAGAVESSDGPSELMAVAIVQQVQFYLSTDNLRRPDTFLLDIMVRIAVQFCGLPSIHMCPRGFARVGKAWWRSPARCRRQLPQNHSAHHQTRLAFARLAPWYAYKCLCATYTILFICLRLYPTAPLVELVECETLVRPVREYTEAESKACRFPAVVYLPCRFAQST